MMKALNSVVADVLDEDVAENDVTVEQISIVDSCESKLYSTLSCLTPVDSVSDNDAPEHEEVVNQLRLVCAGISQVKASMMSLASKSSSIRAGKIRAVQ